MLRAQLQHLEVALARGALRVGNRGVVAHSAHPE